MALISRADGSATVNYDLRAPPSRNRVPAAGTVRIAGQPALPPGVHVRRAEPDSFQVVAGADKVRDAGGNRLTGIEVTFQITCPAGGPGDDARAILPDAVMKSHDRLCTVYLDNPDHHLPHSGPFRARKL